MVDLCCDRKDLYNELTENGLKRLILIVCLKLAVGIDILCTNYCSCSISDPNKITTVSNSLQENAGHLVAAYDSGSFRLCQHKRKKQDKPLLTFK